MSNITRSRHERLADAATDKAHDLSLRLDHLTGLLKLAAFAIEARRVLSGIHEAKKDQPVLAQAVTKAVPTSNTWLSMDDSVGEVLNYVARQLEEVNTGFTDSVYRLSRLKKGGAA